MSVYLFLFRAANNFLMTGHKVDTKHIISRCV